LHTEAKISKNLGIVTQAAKLRESRDEHVGGNPTDMWGHCENGRGH